MRDSAREATLYSNASQLQKWSGKVRCGASPFELATSCTTRPLLDALSRLTPPESANVAPLMASLPKRWTRLRHPQTYLNETQKKKGNKKTFAPHRMLFLNW